MKIENLTQATELHERLKKIAAALSHVRKADDQRWSVSFTSVAVPIHGGGGGGEFKIATIFASSGGSAAEIDRDLLIATLEEQEARIRLEMQRLGIDWG